MKDIFLTNIKIEKIRHLENINISISNKKRKHLILTGKNGSGKTSVLDYLRFQLQLYLTKKTTLHSSDFYNFGMRILFNDSPLKLIKSGEFILAYFGAKRSNNTFNIPKGVKKIEKKAKYNLTEQAGKSFLQHITNMKFDKMFAESDNETELVKKIDDWFKMFNNLLKEIFNDEEIHLKFNKTDYNYEIIQKNREVIDFTKLSDGYSAIFNIISELMMRMENHKTKLYDLQGIVLIDEIETHLHVELEKKILPFLTKVFPKIQFIVTTHSPFFLNSISNTVIYDLEKHIREEDFSAYAYDSIVETYFDNNKYSAIIQQKLNRYKKLLFKENISRNEKSELNKLEYYFENIPAFVAPELISAFQNLQL